MPPHKSAPLTDDEIEKIRTIIESDERVRWFWSRSKSFAIALGAVIAGLTIGFEALAKVVKWLATGK